MCCKPDKKGDKRRVFPSFFPEFFFDYGIVPVLWVIVQDGGGGIPPGGKGGWDVFAIFRDNRDATCKGWETSFIELFVITQLPQVM